MTRLARTDEFMASVGWDAWRVGGSVRDELLGLPAKDADYVVFGQTLESMTELAKAQFSRGNFGVTPLSLRTGQQAGIRIRRKGLGAIEVMMPRSDRKIAVGDTGNEHHAFEFILDGSLTHRDDAVRRDFTFNAIYKNAKTGEIRDPLGGAHDLADELICITHEDSFRDDPLRILRALRFQSKFGFDLDQITGLTMEQYAEGVTGLTGRGVSGTAWDELVKILRGPNVANAMRTMRDTGVLASFLPELAEMIGFDSQNSHHSFTVDEHTFVALDAAARMGCSLRVRLAILFHDSGKPEVAWMGDDGFLHYYAAETPDGAKEDHAVASKRRAVKALKRLNAPKDLMRDVPILVENHMVPLSMKVKPTKIRKWRVTFGDDMLADLLKHRLADCMGKGSINYDDLSAIARMERIREEAVAQGVPASAKDMKDAGLIDGHDLIEMGVDKQKIGEILAILLHEIVSDPAKRMDREWLLSRAKKLAGKT